MIGSLPCEPSEYLRGPARLPPPSPSRSPSPFGTFRSQEPREGSLETSTYVINIIPHTLSWALNRPLHSFNHHMEFIPISQVRKVGLAPCPSHLPCKCQGPDPHLDLLTPAPMFLLAQQAAGTQTASFLAFSVKTIRPTPFRHWSLSLQSLSPWRWGTSDPWKPTLKLSVQHWQTGPKAEASSNESKRPPG